MPREQILERLEPRPLPVASVAIAPNRELFADRVGDAESLLSVFGTRLHKLSGELQVCKNVLDAARWLHELVSELGVKRLALAPDALVETVTRVYKPLSDLCTGALTGPQLSGRGLADCELGISGCDALIARTGSVALRSSHAGGRRLSVLVPTHVVLARQAQLVPDVSAWLETLPGDPSWGTAHLISGPSRTADIEKVLVLGAHGPKRLIVLVIQP